MQAVTEVGGDTVACIGHGDAAGQSLGKDAIKQFQGDLRLAQWATLRLRNSGPIQTLAVAQPTIGKEQAQVQGVMSARADVVDGDGDLTVGLLTQGAAVLPLHTHGAAALLGEGHVVEEKDAFGAGESLREQGAVATQQLARIPGALVDELLQGLVLVSDVQCGGQGNASGERLDALAFSVEEESLQVNAGPLRRPSLREVGGEESSIVGKPGQNSRGKVRSRSLHPLSTKKLLAGFVQVNGVVLESLNRTAQVNEDFGTSHAR